MPSHSTATSTSTESPPPALLVSLEDAARMVGISRRELYRLLDANLVESRWHNRRRLVPVASIEAWAATLPSQRD